MRLQELIKMEKKLQKIHLQAHYQILSIIILKEFIELNVNTSIMVKNVKLVELDITIVTVFLNTRVLKMI